MKRILFFTLLLGLLVSFGNEGWLKLYKLRNFERSIAEENRLLREHTLTLLKEVSDLREPQYIEHYIREELGWVRENEILYDTQTP